MESHMVTALMNQTGLSSQASHALLQSKGWDLSSALTTFENVKNTVSLGKIAILHCCPGIKPLILLLYSPYITDLKSMNYDQQQDQSVDHDSSMANNLDIPANLPLQITPETYTSNKNNAYRRPSLLKTNALDVEDCKSMMKYVCVCACLYIILYM